MDGATSQHGVARQGSAALRELERSISAAPQSSSGRGLGISRRELKELIDLERRMKPTASSKEVPCSWAHHNLLFNSFLNSAPPRAMWALEQKLGLKG